MRKHAVFLCLLARLLLIESVMGPELVYEE